MLGCTEPIPLDYNFRYQKNKDLIDSFKDSK